MCRGDALKCSGVASPDNPFGLHNVGAMQPRSRRAPYIAANVISLICSLATTSFVLPCVSAASSTSRSAV